MAGLCTLANLKLVLFPTSYTDATDDAVLQLYIDALTDEIQEYTCRMFVGDAALTDYYYDIPRTTTQLYVPEGINTLNTVGYATTTQPASGGTYTTITATNYFLRPLPQDRRVDFPADTIVITPTDAVDQFYPGYNTVKINAKLGFAAVPAAIERIAIAIITRRWQARRGGQADGIGTSDFGGPLLRFTSAEEMRVLDRYVDPGIG